MHMRTRSSSPIAPASPRIRHNRRDSKPSALVEEAAYTGTHGQAAVKGNPWCDKVKGDTFTVPAGPAVSVPAAANRASAYACAQAAHGRVHTRTCVCQGYPSFTVTRQQAVNACNQLKTLPEDRVFYHWGTWCGDCDNAS